MSENTNLTPEQKKKDIEKFIAEMNSKYKMTTINYLPKILDPTVKTIPTGSHILDNILGGGLAEGRIIEFYGAEASGKTSFSLTAAAEVQRRGGTVLLLDIEQAADPKYARKLGVNTNDLIIAQPSIAEECLEMIKDACASGKIDMVIVDSVAAMVPKAEAEQDLEKHTIGLVARLLSKALKQITALANQNKTTVIFINQTRANIGVMYGPSSTTTGGNALKFYASQRIEVKRKGKVEDENGEIIGNEVLLKVVKNKIAPPFGEGLTVLTFNQGVNNIAEIQVLGEQLGVVSKEGRTFYFNGNTEGLDLSQGEAILIEDGKVKIAVNTKPALKEIETNEPLREAIIAEVLRKLEIKNGFSSDGDDEEV